MKQIDKSIKKRLTRKMCDENGATLLFALLFFVVCAVAGSITISSAYGVTSSLIEMRDNDAEYYAVSSAAKYLIDTLTESEFEITDVKTEKYTVGKASLPERIEYTNGDIHQIGENTGNSFILTKLKDCFSVYLSLSNAQRWASDVNFKYMGTAIDESIIYNINVEDVEDLQVCMFFHMNDNGGVSMTIYKENGEYALQINCAATIRTSEKSEYIDEEDGSRYYATTKKASITYDKNTMTIQRTHVPDGGE